MKNENKENKPLMVRLPGFINEKEIGLGDLIKRATSALGIKPCSSCEQRADVLNSWVIFNSKKK